MSSLIHYTPKMLIVAAVKRGEKDEIVGLGQYAIVENTHIADLALVVRDDYQNKGIGRALLSYLTKISMLAGGGFYIEPHQIKGTASETSL